MISNLITDYLEKNAYSYRQMAAEISRQLDVPNAVSYQTISNWANGTFNPHPPTMQWLAKHGSGDLKMLARDILKELDATLIAN
jgi:transcriptional regulator with XRE-family HTH domain